MIDILNWFAADSNRLFGLIVLLAALAFAIGYVISAIGEARR